MRAAVVGTRWLGPFVALALMAPAVEALEPDVEACMAAYVAGQRQRKAASLTAARQSFVVCAQSACPQALRGDCARWLEEVEAAQPSIVVVARQGKRDVRDARLVVDGSLVARRLEGRALALDPGVHRVQLTVTGHPTLTRTLLLREGERRRAVEFVLPEPPIAPERDWTTIGVLSGVGAAGLGAFTFFALRSHSRRNDLEACKGHCPQDDVDRVRRDQIIADVSLGVGVVALGAAAYFFFTPSTPVAVGVTGGAAPHVVVRGQL